LMCQLGTSQTLIQVQLWSRNVIAVHKQFEQGRLS
jgi:hypothetical protein